MDVLPISVIVLTDQLPFLLEALEGKPVNQRFMLDAVEVNRRHLGRLLRQAEPPAIEHLAHQLTERWAKGMPISSDLYGVAFDALWFLREEDPRYM